MTHKLTETQKLDLYIRLNKLNSKIKSLSTDEEWANNRKQIGEVLYQLNLVEDPADMNEVEKANSDYIRKRTKSIIQNSGRQPMAAYFINQKALDELGNLVDEEDENFYSDFHDRLVNDMVKYATIVRDFDLKLAKAKKTNDTNYYREEYSRLDNARRRQHDAVIANLAVANRINKSEGLEPVIDVGDNRTVHDVHRTDIGNAVISWLAETNLQDVQMQNETKKMYTLPIIILTQ
jgi:predicted house-cleaning noncanonical NTP pyrophosphatase (MazG superfamily)